MISLVGLGGLSMFYLGVWTSLVRKGVVTIFYELFSLEWFFLKLVLMSFDEGRLSFLEGDSNPGFSLELIRCSAFISRESLDRSELFLSVPSMALLRAGLIFLLME